MSARAAAAAPSGGPESSVGGQVAGSKRKAVSLVTSTCITLEYRKLPPFASSVAGVIKFIAKHVSGTQVVFLTGPNGEMIKAHPRPRTKASPVDLDSDSDSDGEGIEYSDPSIYRLRNKVFIDAVMERILSGKPILREYHFRRYYQRDRIAGPRDHAVVTMLSDEDSADYTRGILDDLHRRSTKQDLAKVTTGASKKQKHNDEDVSEEEGQDEDEAVDGMEAVDSDDDQDQDQDQVSPKFARRAKAAIGSRIVDGKPEYQIQWEASWVPVELLANANCKAVVEEFIKEQKQQMVAAFRN